MLHQSGNGSFRTIPIIEKRLSKDNRSGRLLNKTGRVKSHAIVGYFISTKFLKSIRAAMDRGAFGPK